MERRAALVHGSSASSTCHRQVLTVHVCTQADTSPVDKGALDEVSLAFSYCSALEMYTCVCKQCRRISQHYLWDSSAKEQAVRELLSLLPTCCPNNVEWLSTLLQENCATPGPENHAEKANAANKPGGTEEDLAAVSFHGQTHHNNMQSMNIPNQLTTPTTIWKRIRALCS